MGADANVKFHLSIRKVFGCEGDERQLGWPSRVESPSLEAARTHLDVVLGSPLRGTLLGQGLDAPQGSLPATAFL